jgi:hypothetical protein
MTQTIMTFIARVKPERSDDLAKLLCEIQTDPEKNALVPFRSLQSLHFASFVLHTAPDFGPYLIFENNFDGPLDAYIADLYTHAASGVHQIYSCCLDYAVTNASDRQGIVDYLRGCVVRPSAYHIGNVGRSAERILQERKLRDALEAHADELAPSRQASSNYDLFKKFQQFITANRDFSWIPGVGPRQSFWEKYLPWVKLVLAVVIPGIPILVTSIIWMPILRFKEDRDAVQSDTAETANLKNLVEVEDRVPSVQNHMASITMVKSGWFRRLVLRTVLFFINLLARAVSTHGNLSGIPSIHFAHWALIDGGRRLLFLSNFDGSWENYLDDFIDKSPHGLTSIWGNTVDFPRTKWLVLGGAQDGPRFKAVARDHQIVTNAWYSAYWDLTVQGIDNNSSVREDLPNVHDKDSAKAWLQRL